MLAQLLADGGFLVFGGLGLIVILIVLLTSIFWIWMLVDALTNTSLQGVEKIVWVLVILFGHVVGALIYFFVARSSRGGPAVS